MRLVCWSAPVKIIIGVVVSSALGLALAADALAAQPTSSSGTSFSDIAEGVGVAIGAAIALLGAPGVYLGIKKTQVEIRKLELEALRLQGEQGTPASLATDEPSQTYMIHVEGAANHVAITADPRLLAPLLLLLDFIVATIILTIAGYLLNFGGFDIFSPLLAAVGIVLFTPIFREARRLKRVLTSPVPTVE